MSLSRSLGLGLSGNGGGGGAPASALETLQALLAGSAKSAIWLPATDSTLDQTATPSVPVTPGSGDPVGYVEDLSGNGNHLTQSTTALKPDATQGLTFDGVDDCLDISMTLPTDATFVAGIALTSVTNEVPIGEVSGTDGFAAWVISGNASAASSAGSVFVDGVATATRGDLATAIGSGGVFHRLENRNGNFSTWSGVRLGKRSNGFQPMNGALSAVVLIDNAALGATDAATALALAQTLVDEINGAL